MLLGGLSYPKGGFILFGVAKPIHKTESECQATLYSIIMELEKGNIAHKLISRLLRTRQLQIQGVFNVGGWVEEQGEEYFAFLLKGLRLSWNQGAASFLFFLGLLQSLSW